MPLPKVVGYPYWDRRPEPCPIVPKVAWRDRLVRKARGSKAS